MKIVLAVDKFKGSLDAISVCESMERGIKKASPDAVVVKVPMADGGDGTTLALCRATGGTLTNVRVTGPLGDPVEASYAMLGDGKTAVMEMATAAGLVLVPEHRRDPMVTTTRGVGEMILHAVENGARRVILGIGGSATNDAGAGMAQALGISITDKNGREIGFGASGLLEAASVSLEGLPREVANTEFVVACDVENPLYGVLGAAHVYGPQKGATAEEVEILDRALMNFSRIAQKDLNKDVADMPGSGAAGGLGAGLMAFLGARLRSGVDLVVEATELQKKMAGAQLVITGEGRLDDQSLMGKVPHGVARLAKKLGIPVVAIVGAYAPPGGLLYQEGIGAVFATLNKPVSLKEAMTNANDNVELITEQVIRCTMLLRDATLHQAL